MLKKFLTLSLAAVMLTVTAFASTDIAFLDYALAADEAATPTFSYAVGDVNYIGETAKVADSYQAQAKHEDISSLPKWDGTAADAITGGNGTQESPYLISDGGELAKFAQLVNAGNKTLWAKLDRDIDLVGTTAWNNFSITEYAGTFDGQGHNIYNFRIASNDGRAFFTKLIANGTLKNFNMINATGTFGSTTETTAMGLVCALSLGTPSTGTYPGTADMAYIDNVYVQGSVSLFPSVKKVNTFGSIAGRISHASITNCFSDVDINFEGNTNSNAYKTFTDGATLSSGYAIGIGGVVGAVNKAKNRTVVDNCGNAGTIKAPQNRRVGGVIGAAGTDSGFSSINIGNLYNYGDVTGLGQVAGCIGWLYANSNNNVSNANWNWYSTGNVVANTTENTYAGGIVTGKHAASWEYDKGLYCSGDVSIAVTDAESGATSYTYNNLCGLISVGIVAQNNRNDGFGAPYYRNDVTFTDAEGNSTAKWVTATAAGVTSNVGTGMTLAGIKALDQSDLDFGITKNKGALVLNSNVNNTGFPVLASQKNHVMLDEATYEIAKYTNSASEAVDKYITINAAHAGYAVLDVKAIIEGATLEIYNADASTKLYDKAVSAKGVILLPTEGESEIVIKAADGSRVLAGEGTAPALAGIEAAIIKATLSSNDNATVVLALFDGTTLEKVEYLSDVTAVDGKVSGIIDLTDEDVAGCTLKAFLWENDTLTPILQTPAELN